MLTLATLVIPLLATWIWWPLGTLTRRARLIAFAATALLGCAPALLLRLLQTGALPYPVIAYLQVPGGWVMATLLLMALLVLVRDLLWLGARATRATAWAQRLHTPRMTVSALLMAATVSAGGVWTALQPPTVHEQHVALPHLPASLDGLHVAVIADLHASPINDAHYVETVVERTLAARPDLVVLPGDLVDGDVHSTAAHVAPLARLRAPLGVWAAPGNHEYYSGYDTWRAEFRRLGLGLLANRTQLLDVHGTRLALSGVGDPVYGRTSPNNADPRVPEGVPPDVAAVARAARKAGADFHLLLAHQPRLAHDSAAQGIGLQLSGHTHGGHIRGLDRWVVARANNGFVRGIYTVGDMRLFVSNGAGLWAGFAVRLGVPPRIDLLVLRRP